MQAVFRERDILRTNKNNPNQCKYLPNLEHSFKDADYIYFVMDYIQGGTLEEFLTKNKERMSAEARRFISAQLVLALEYLQG